MTAAPQAAPQAAPPCLADKAYEPHPATRVAFIGLGTMGGPMAAHLKRAGHHLSVYNRGTARAQAWLAEHGNPYRVTVSDPEGRIGIEFGVVAVPETFVIDGKWAIPGAQDVEVFQRALVRMSQRATDAE